MSVRLSAGFRLPWRPIPWLTFPLGTWGSIRDGRIHWANCTEIVRYVKPFFRRLAILAEHVDFPLVSRSAGAFTKWPFRLKQSRDRQAAEIQRRSDPSLPDGPLKSDRAIQKMLYRTPNAEYGVLSVTR